MHFRCGKLLHDVFVTSFSFDYEKDWPETLALCLDVNSSCDFFTSFSLICCYFSGLKASSSHYQDRRGLDKDQNGELTI